MNETNMSIMESEPEAGSSRAIGYMLLFRGADWDEGRTLEEQGEMVERFMGWMNGLAKAGKVKGGQPLARRGKVITGGRVLDGPFAETKEAVGGYLWVDAGSMEAAVEIARGYPGGDYGIEVEVRPILETCPCFDRYFARAKAAGLEVKRPAGCY